MRLLASHTHFYPGAHGRIEGRAEDGETEIEFADGAHAGGSLHGARLKVAPYRTMAGTEMAARIWLLRTEGNRFHIQAPPI